MLGKQTCHFCSVQFIMSVEIADSCLIAAVTFTLCIVCHALEVIQPWIQCWCLGVILILLLRIVLQKTNKQTKQTIWKQTNKQTNKKAAVQYCKRKCRASHILHWLGQLTNVTWHLMNWSSYKDLFSRYMNLMYLKYLINHVLKLSKS